MSAVYSTLYSWFFLWTTTSHFIVVLCLMVIIVSTLIIINCFVIQNGVYLGLCNLSKGHHQSVTPLYTLPVKRRVLYKQVLITFNVLYHNNPSYLRDLLTIHNRNLRSSSHHLLSVGSLHANCFIFALLQTLCSRGRPNVTLIVSAETETRPKVYALHSAETESRPKV